MLDDIRDTRPWFWVLFLIVFAVAAAGLYLAISAKNSSVDEKKVVNEATAQVREELSGLNGALKVADELQEEQTKVAARDRARIKREVAAAVTGTKRRLHKLSLRVASLEAETSALHGRNTKLRKNVRNLSEGQETLSAEVATIKRRLRNFSANGGA